jgi:NAD(P)-dependent dehydrogenase (short-subunit alcohol dehydrogenase family)
MDVMSILSRGGEGKAMKPDRGIIIVSGSNGRIGDAVMRRFAGRFEEVVGFDRKAPQPAPPGCVYVSEHDARAPARGQLPISRSEASSAPATAASSPISASRNS